MSVDPNTIPIIEVAAKVYSVIKGIFDDEVKEQEQFVKEAVASLGEANPDYNVLIYHNQDSGYDLPGAVHDHYEPLLGTKGYEVFVLTTGSFDLRTGNHVYFGGQNNCPYV
ncbi:hypothetical protein B0T25DRAFT_584470 [Lasiosphaeria hispida]|uniref:Uncharacterized protein n=1 Tax=Lasiosphaeria hispida TaxID=260671 RepID=A0AAJ0H840_9PEZI|nr:hypothetical protein B0T25DRAFT_584470 [Lasiosphaeria hispida]